MQYQFEYRLKFVTAAKQFVKTHFIVYISAI